MAGTRTAPAVHDGTAETAGTKYVTTLSLVDKSGDTFSESIVTTNAPSAANIEAWAAAYQNGSNASVYQVSLQKFWKGAKSTSNAVAAERNSVKDGINVNFEDVTALKSYTGRLIAPVDTTMSANADIPTPTTGPLGALINAYGLILNTVSGAFVATTAQFTERRERKNNPKVPATG